MKTPVQELIFKALQFNVRKEMLVPFIIGNRIKLQEDEKKFIKKVFKDALNDSDLTEDQKEVKAEIYYNLNYAQE